MSFIWFYSLGRARASKEEKEKTKKQKEKKKKLDRLTILANVFYNSLCDFLFTRAKKKKKIRKTISDVVIEEKKKELKDDNRYTIY